MGDVDELQSFIVSGIDVIIGEGLMWIVTVALVMLLDWRVASARSAPLIVVYLLLRVFNKQVAPIYKAARERLGDVSTRLQENLTASSSSRSSGAKSRRRIASARRPSAYYDQQIRAINARQHVLPLQPRRSGFSATSS